MKTFQMYIRFISFFLPFVSCVPHHSFVATPYTSLLVEKKGDVQLSASVRPFKYYGFEATVALTDFMSLRAAYSGFYKFDNVSLSIPFFKNYEKTGFFIAPMCSYQHNIISRGSKKKNYKYNGEYLSPALVIGLKLKNTSKISHQIMFKTQYNFVNKYEYYFEKSNGSGRSSDFEKFDNERFGNNIPSFFSFEPTYALLSRRNKYFSFQWQIGAIFCQTVTSHEYSFRANDYPGYEVMKSLVSKHPKSFPVNISFAMMFNGTIKHHKNPE